MTTVNLPPGPKGRFLIGHIPELNRDPLSFLAECTKKYGDVVLWEFGPFPAYLLNDPKLIEEVYVTQFQNFVKSSVYRRGLRMLGNGLLISEGSFWQRQRRLMQPAFHQERINAYGRIMVDYTNRMLDGWQDGEIRDIHHEMMSLTLEVVCKALFNIDVESEISRIQACLEALMQFNDRLSNQYLIPKWLPIPSNLRYQQAINELDEVVDRLIIERRKTGIDTGDLLSTLIQVRDEDDGTGMTTQQLRDEMKTLLLAGHETTANALTWTWYLLSQHPQVEEKLQAELKTVLNGQAPSVANMRQLRYTEQIITEAMRLYPPAWGMSRVAVKDCKLGEYDVKAGTIAFVSEWVTHRNPKFFENPEVFQPERWTENFRKQLPTFAYFPFGGGPRFCIGKSFALMEAVLILAAIAQRFSFTLQPEPTVVLQPSITLRPKYGIRMQLHKRSNFNNLVETATEKSDRVPKL